MVKKKKKKDNTPIIRSKFITFKNTMKKICRDGVIERFEDVCYRINSIVKSTYYFIRLYYAYLFENKIEFPTINSKMIRDIFALISDVSRKQTTSEQLLMNSMMGKFNETTFSLLGLERVSRDNLTQALTYETERIIVNIETNIKEHFLQHFNRYIKIKFNYYNKETFIRRQNLSKDNLKNELKKLKSNYEHIKWSIGNIHEPVTRYYNAFILEQRNILFLNHEHISKNVFYDVTCSPLKYLYTFYAIANTFEKCNLDHNLLESFKYHNISVGKSNIDIMMYNTLNSTKLRIIPTIDITSFEKRTKTRKVQMFNVTPLQTSLIPKYFTIETAVLIQIFGPLIKKNIHVFEEFSIYNVEDLRLSYNNDEIKFILWNLIFNMEDTYFSKKGKFNFNYFVTTDCFSCSSLFLHKDHPSIKKGRNLKSKSKTKINNSITYIEDHIINSTLDLKKEVVCIDPNKRDIIYCGKYKDAVNKTGLVRYRYTSCQRRKELKTRKYNRFKLNASDFDIKQLESCKVISKRTVNFTNIEKYIKNCNTIDRRLTKEYAKPIYRKLKWYSYLNKLKSENRMVKNFKKKMGSNKDVIIAIGDYSCKSSNLTGTLPTIAKKVIDIFRKAQYETYIINEFNTSKICNKCGDTMETFMKRESPKPKHKGKIINVHGLLRCTSVKHNCETIHNRDTNAVLNMLKIVTLTKETLERPTLYCQPSSTFLQHKPS